MSNEEKARMIAEQCKPCSEDFYKGIEQGVVLALNAENGALKKAAKWDELNDQIAACYVESDGKGNVIERKEDDMDLVVVGEIAAGHFGWL